MTPEQRSLRGRMGAYAQQAKHDPREITKAARAGRWAKYERQVDPDGTLDPAERQRRAEAAMRADMAGLALKSSMARAKKKASK